MRATQENFISALEQIFDQSEQLGLVAIEASSGNLHRRVGDYPGENHRMPACCGAMRIAMQSSDSIVSEPPKGNGATLVIRYCLPRQPEA